MMIHHRAFAAALVFVVVGTLTVTAQPQAVPTQARSVASTTVTRTAVSRLKADAFTTIQGNALSSTNGALNDVNVRLRDARFGRIVDTQVTDKSGMFAFKAVDPGTYIVEVIANDQMVMAASQLLNVNAGEAVSAVVKLPFRIPAMAGLLGNTSVPSVAALAGEAAASGITALVPTQPVSPTQ